MHAVVREVPGERGWTIFRCESNSGHVNHTAEANQTKFNPLESDFFNRIQLDPHCSDQNRELHRISCPAGLELIVQSNP